MTRIQNGKKKERKTANREETEPVPAASNLLYPFPTFPF
jgi:hypothetical protein